MNEDGIESHRGVGTQARWSRVAGREARSDCETAMTRGRVLTKTPAASSFHSTHVCLLTARFRFSRTLVLHGLPDLLGNAVAILLALLRQTAATLLALRHRLEHANFLQLLEAATDHTPGGTAEVAGQGAPPLLRAVDLRERAHPGALAHVQPAGERGAADEIPILVVRGELARDRGLHEVHELRERDLALLLEVGGVALHELEADDSSEAADDPRSATLALPRRP